MNTFFFSQDSETNSHLLNFNTPSLAQKLLLHKIQHAPHPEQRERDKKKTNLSNAPQHRNFRNKRSLASCSNRNLLPSALQSQALRKRKKGKKLLRGKAPLEGDGGKKKSKRNWKLKSGKMEVPAKKSEFPAR